MNIIIGNFNYLTTLAINKARDYWPKLRIAIGHLLLMLWPILVTSLAPILIPALQDYLIQTGLSSAIVAIVILYVTRLTSAYGAGSGPTQERDYW